MVRQRDPREREPRGSRGLLGAVLVASLGAFVACNAVLGNEERSLEPIPLADDDAGAPHDPNAPPVLVPSDGGELPPSCTDSCPLENTKRCSVSSSAGVEICGRSSEGCLAWRQDSDCAPGFSCDTAKNDGSCKAGCTNDVGCDASKVGTTRCILPSGPNGTAEQTCAVVGACYQWKTTRSSIPQQCSISGNYCVFDVRKNCIASANGACTQHVSQTNACPQGSTCQLAGQCVQAPLCGGGLTCSTVWTNGASPCNQALPPTAPAIFCCPVGMRIVAGKCQTA